MFGHEVQKTMIAKPWHPGQSASLPPECPKNKSES